MVLVFKVKTPKIISMQIKLNHPLREFQIDRIETMLQNVDQFQRISDKYLQILGRSSTIKDTIRFLGLENRSYLYPFILR